ncbi:MAG: hypothetical protein BJ554DRAFT_7027 [Olpidium bornovanus]|uniref:Uncharacterized protein n=1 Tax=Olpidium bornovanus TaxID=278681 RepID=A0A8H7ZWR9_9FUNG|nr:MAG: hypothetical protein BJ554DRAFT_7027 [Olpidium bornovanus]
MKAADAGAAAAAAAGGPFLSVKEDENRYYSRRDHKDIGMDFAASLASHHPRTPEAKREPDAEYPEPSELNGADDVDGVSPLMLRNAEDDEGDGDYRWGPTETEAAGVRIMESDGGGGGGGGGGGSGPLSDPRKLPFPSSSGADVDVEDISDIDDYEPPAPATKAPAPLVPAKREASAGPEVAKRAAPAPEKLTARPQMQRPSDADAAEAAKATCGDARPESRGKAAPAGVPAEPEKLSTKKEGLAEANGTEPSLEEILETIQKHIRSKVSSKSCVIPKQKAFSAPPVSEERVEGEEESSESINLPPFLNPFGNPVPLFPSPPLLFLLFFVVRRAKKRRLRPAFARSHRITRASPALLEAADRRKPHLRAGSRDEAGFSRQKVTRNAGDSQSIEIPRPRWVASSVLFPPRLSPPMPLWSFFLCPRPPPPFFFVGSWRRPFLNTCNCAGFGTLNVR